MGKFYFSRKHTLNWDNKFGKRNECECESCVELMIESCIFTIKEVPDKIVQSWKIISSLEGERERKRLCLCFHATVQVSSIRNLWLTLFNDGPINALIKIGHSPRHRILFLFSCFSICNSFSIMLRFIPLRNLSRVRVTLTSLHTEKYPLIFRILCILHYSCTSKFSIFFNLKMKVLFSEGWKKVKKGVKVGVKFRLTFLIIFIFSIISLKYRDRGARF